MKSRLSSLLVALPAAFAGPAMACDMPTIPPTDVPAAVQPDGRQLHIVAGSIGICDMAIRDFEVDLPDLHDIRSMKVQLAMGGFIRRYGVRQIGFSLQGVEMQPIPKGVKIRFTAAIDGLDRYQLAYTLYLSTTP